MSLLATDVFQAGFMKALLVLVSLAMLAGGIRMMFKWPRGRPGGFLVGGTMILLASVTALAVIAVRVTEGYAAGWVILLVPGSWGAWFVLGIVGGVYIHLTKREIEQQGQRQAHQVFLAEKQPGTPGVSDADDPAEPEAKPAAAAEPVVIARCGACMGRWRTTRRVAEALLACPKCGVSPPQLRLQPVK